MWGKEQFNESPYLAEDAAWWLVKLKARMAGYDFNQDAATWKIHKKIPVKGKDFPIHLILLGNGVLNIEYLNNLSKVSKRRVKLIALPIMFAGCEGAPARVVAIED